MNILSFAILVIIKENPIILDSFSNFFFFLSPFFPLFFFPSLRVSSTPVLMQASFSCALVNSPYAIFLAKLIKLARKLDEVFC